MIIKSFLGWMESAPTGSRAQAAGALARAYLYSDMDWAEREDAEAALTFLLDDSDPVVRVALAVAFGGAAEAPSHIISALLLDEDEVAMPLLSGSVHIPEHDLIDIVATETVERCVAVAQRPRLSVGLAAAICEVACAEACAALLSNETVDITRTSLQRLVERFGDNRAVKDALMARAGVPLQIRHMMLRCYTESLCEHPQVLGARMTRAPEQLVADAQDRSTIMLAWTASEVELEGLVEHLVVSGQMTSVLLLRAAITGCFNLLNTSLARLSGVDSGSVFEALGCPYGRQLRKVLAQAGLPERTYGLFQECLQSWQRVETLQIDHWAKSRMVISDLIELQEKLQIESLGDLQDLLYRLSNETARESARTRVLSVVGKVA